MLTFLRDGMCLLNPQANRGTLQSLLGLCGEMKRDRLGAVLLKKPEFIHSSFIYLFQFRIGGWKGLHLCKQKEGRNARIDHQNWTVDARSIKMFVLVPFDCYVAIPKVQTLPCSRSPSLYWPDSLAVHLRLCLEERFTDNQRWWSADNTHKKNSFKTYLKGFRSSQHR